jgi:hypothetical protein
MRKKRSTCSLGVIDAAGNVQATPSHRDPIPKIAGKGSTSLRPVCPQSGCPPRQRVPPRHRSVNDTEPGDALPACSQSSRNFVGHDAAERPASEEVRTAWRTALYLFE